MYLVEFQLLFQIASISLSIVRRVSKHWKWLSVWLEALVNKRLTKTARLLAAMEERHKKMASPESAEHSVNVPLTNCRHRDQLMFRLHQIEIRYSLTQFSCTLWSLERVQNPQTLRRRQETRLHHFVRNYILPTHAHTQLESILRLDTGCKPRERKHNGMTFGSPSIYDFLLPSSHLTTKNSKESDIK